MCARWSKCSACLAFDWLKETINNSERLKERCDSRRRFLYSQNLGLDEPTVPGLDCGLRSIAHVQLTQNIRYVILHCAFRQKQSLGNLAIAGAFRNKANYLTFTFGERFIM